MIFRSFLPSLQPRSYAVITVFLALVFVGALNLPVLRLFYSLAVAEQPLSLGFLVAFPLLLIAAFTFLFSLITWPYVTKVIFSLLLILSAMVAYASFTYGTIFNEAMIESVFETDSGEAVAYLSVSSVLWCCGFGVLPAFILWRIPLQRQSFKELLRGKLICMGLSLVIVAVIAGMYYKNIVSMVRNYPQLRQLVIPTYYLDASVKYLYKKYLKASSDYIVLDEAPQQKEEAVAQAQQKPNLVVFVLGETARAQNYTFNGYSRETTPYTQPFQLIAFRNTVTCGTETAVSVPCMFSNMTQKNYSRERADNQDNVLDLLQRAGVSLLWKENDGGDKNVMRDSHNKKEIDRDREDQYCNGSTCYDMALLENFDEEIKELKGNSLVVLHLIGSHGPAYYLRYPKEQEVFLPNCERKDLEQCSREEIINSYDNTLVYTDYVVAETIKKLQEAEDSFNTALIYMSDHGESLGEKGVYLHGLPYSFAPDYQKRVPLMMWFSKGFVEAKQLDIQCLRKEAQQPSGSSQDNLFHSLLGVMDIETTAYDEDLDLFAPCRLPKERQ